MYQTSQEYKDSMKRPIRERSFMKVQLGLINQEAQQSASLENTDYNGFSDPSTLFNQHTVKRYATYEQNMFRADGTMYFLPKDNASYWKDGYTCTSLFNNELHIKFVFGYGKSDIKGLTIQFGENYPTKFSVMTDDGTSVEFLNNSQVFKTDTVFSNTAFIRYSDQSVKRLQMEQRIIPMCRVLILRQQKQILRHMKITGGLLTGKWYFFQSPVRKMLDMLVWQ